jgi:hypothetical protein
MTNSNYNPIDDPDQFPEHFPKPIYYVVESGRMLYDYRYASILYPPSVYSYNGLNIVETITTDDTVSPNVWTWFKGLWK